MMGLLRMEGEEMVMLPRDRGLSMKIEVSGPVFQDISPMGELGEVYWARMRFR